MKLYSTRNLNMAAMPKKAIIEGLAPDGGLFSPKIEDIENSKFDIKDLINYDYKKVALHVFKIFLSDFDEKDLEKCINAAYSNNNFPNYENIVAPISKIGKDYLLELYHGRTSAFKDVALSILPYFLTTAYKSESNKNKIYILTATSGDTGKAALAGFQDVENVNITVFYPTDGVSPIQKLQMQTSPGNNVDVVAINGNFDDCQRLVKEIYTDKNIFDLCQKHNVILSSANSINIGRLVPQIIYYISSYIKLVKDNEIKLYDKVNFVVPTGNFGNILAGFIAKTLGLPINKLICASNENDVLTEFINTGSYNRNRQFYKTISPSMDILVSSNLERLLFLLSNNDSNLISNLMADLNKNGSYKIQDFLLNKIKEHFVAFSASESECKAAIREAFDKDHRLIDTHTAIAYAVLKKYNSSASSKNIILSTASPYKFAKSVLSSLNDTDIDSLNDFDIIDKLFKMTNEPIPQNLLELKTKKVRFNNVLSYSESKKYVEDKIAKEKL